MTTGWNLTRIPMTKVYIHVALLALIYSVSLAPEHPAFIHSTALKSASRPLEIRKAMPPPCQLKLQIQRCQYNVNGQ
ncbi:hypothetical protein N656DRAFT_779179 [Canariomyces notabilis]|uniref:Uncharacterized protein n=1 Tax=Canariomyces notabilis TaxID=2074819 RepID=A0AAN6TDB9_9PEZI|nr:hypothetical protein N656DRAFT_779179 [Canariomyces arenarius]